MALRKSPADNRFGNIVTACRYAAHALTLGMVVVTDNVRELRRVKGLKVENWVR